MNLKIIRNVTRPLKTVFSVPRNITGTLLLPVVVRFGTPTTLSGCIRVTGTVGICSASVAGRGTTRTTIRTMGALSLEIGVPRRLSSLNVRRDSLSHLTATTFTSMYAPNGPQRMAGRVVLSLCGGTL